MKHLKLPEVFNQRLKLFNEDFTKNNYYHAIHLSDRDELFVDRHINFNKKEIDNILSHITDPLINVTVGPNNSDILVKKFKNKEEMDKYFSLENEKEKRNLLFNRFMIDKIDDEWYLASEIILVPSELGGFVKHLNYYKCDQLEGLMVYLKDKKIIE